MAKTPEELLLDRLVCIRQTVNVMNEKLAYLRESKEFCCNLLSSSSSSSSSSGVGNIWLPIVADMETWGVYQPSLGVVLDENDGVQQITDLSGLDHHLVDTEFADNQRALMSGPLVVSDFATNRGFAGINGNMPLSEYLIIAAIKILSVPSENSNNVLMTYRSSTGSVAATVTRCMMIHNSGINPDPYWGKTYNGSSSGVTNTNRELEAGKTYLVEMMVRNTDLGTIFSFSVDLEPVTSESSPASFGLNAVHFGCRQNKLSSNSNVGVEAFVIFDDVAQFDIPANNLKLQQLRSAMYQQFCG